jgi:hypothetical protein
MIPVATRLVVNTIRPELRWWMNTTEAAQEPFHTERVCIHDQHLLADVGPAVVSGLRAAAAGVRDRQRRSKGPERRRSDPVAAPLLRGK